MVTLRFINLALWVSELTGWRDETKRPIIALHAVLPMVCLHWDARTGGLSAKDDDWRQMDVIASYVWKLWKELEKFPNWHCGVMMVGAWKYHLETDRYEVLCKLILIHHQIVWRCAEWGIVSSVPVGSDEDEKKKFKKGRCSCGWHMQIVFLVTIVSLGCKDWERWLEWLTE